MARLPRLALARHAHLVWLQAQPGVPLFATPDEPRRLLDALREAAARHQVAVHGYALSQQSVLLLLTPDDAAGMGRVIQDLGRRWVAATNRRTGRKGSPWCGRYRATVLEPGRDALDAMVFVDLQAAASEFGLDHGSADHHLGRLRVSWLTQTAEYWALGNTPFDRELVWASLLEHGLTEARQQQIRQAARTGWALGSSGFLSRVAELSGRPAAPRRRGRRRKEPAMPRD